VDALDLKIWRSLYPSGNFDPFGLDPRVSTAIVGRRLGLSKSTVSSRIKSWKSDGFMSGYDVWPNLRLFDIEAAELVLVLHEPAGKAAVLDSIGLIDGVFMAWDGKSEYRGKSETYVAVWTVKESNRETNRRLQLAGRLVPLKEALVRDFQFPQCVGVPTPLDWRIIRELRRRPASSITAVAQSVGVTPKTMAARFGRLLDNCLIFYFPLLDLRKLPMVELGITLRDVSGRPQVTSALRQLSPDHFPMNVSYYSSAGSAIYGMFPVGTPAQVEGLVTSVLEIPEVAGVEVTYPHRWRTYGGWLDERIAAKLRFRTSQTS
jgi:DNA-binding Lrp family transcriptional regulator